MTITSCTKEGPTGPVGPAGANGTNGTNGADANETCNLCHNSTVFDGIAKQFELSKHNYGEAAFEEAGNATCAPCHESEAFKYVCANNIPSTFTLNATTGKYANDYIGLSTNAYGELGCSTCHSEIHSTYSLADFSLRTTAPVAMNMWGGAKTIDLAASYGRSNLCIKCHQPRPLTYTSALSDAASPNETQVSDANVLDYDDLASNPTEMFFDSTKDHTFNKFYPGYLSHVHYGTVGAIVAGKGAVEFQGTMPYKNSVHTIIASCQSCHMAEMNGAAGGHSFKAKGNFKGCNTSGCHTSMSSSDDMFTTTQSSVKTLLNQLGEKIKINNVELLHRNSDAETNLWAGLTTNKYDGYLDIFDPTINPEGTFQNPNPSYKWSQTNKDLNASKPKVHLTKAQMGAIINFQFCLREYSLGIHNAPYIKALLTNSIGKLNATGI